MTASGRPTLDEARSRLRELGYLDAGVDRLLFRPVFEWRGGAFLMAILLGAFSAALAALAAVEASEPGFALSAAAAVSLLAHVFVADLLPAALLALALAAFASRARTPGVAATTAGMVSALLIFALWIGGTYSLAREVSARTLLWAIPIGVVALFLAAAVRLGFLALAFARAGKLPRRALRRVFAAAAALGLLVAILLLFSRRERPPAPSPQPSPRSAPVVVLAVDGLDLDGAGKNGPAAEVLAGGATGWWPAERGSPPEIWTTLATGVDPALHRVRALTRVRPLGSPLSLRPPWGTGWYLRGIGPRLGLVANAPVSHSDRRSLDFWEVAASAGIPSLSVGWWAAGPWPGAVVVENREVFARAADGPGADREAIRVFESDSRKGFALSTVYLPGLRHCARRSGGARGRAGEGRRDSAQGGRSSRLGRDRPRGSRRRLASSPGRSGASHRLRRRGRIQWKEHRQRFRPEKRRRRFRPKKRRRRFRPQKRSGPAGGRSALDPRASGDPSCAGPRRPARRLPVRAGNARDGDRSELRPAGRAARFHRAERRPGVSGEAEESGVSAVRKELSVES